MAQDVLSPFHPLVKNFGTLPSSTRNYPPGSYFMDTSTPTNSKLYVVNAAGTAWVFVPPPDATTTTKGGIILAGDLGGSASSPSVVQVAGATAANVADATTKRHSQGTDLGTTNTKFQLNSSASGVQLKDGSGLLAVRNAGDTADASLTANQLNATGGIVQLGGISYLQAGTSFPASPVTNQRFIRTDRQLEYFYDGTRWLSAQMFTIATISSNAGGPVAAGSFYPNVALARYNLGAGVFIENLIVGFYLYSAQSSSNYYSVSLGTNAGTLTPVAGVTNTQAYSTATFTAMSITYAYASNTTFIAQPNIVANGSPGSLQWAATIEYRLIG